MTWYIVRHAEKVFGGYYNAELRHQDEPLTAVGEQSARRIAERLGDRPIAAIYVSAYLRTSQTAAPLAERLGLVPVVDARLNEIDNGQVDAMTEEEFAVAFPDVWRAYVARAADFRFPGGESGAEVDARIGAFFDERLAQHGDDDVVVVVSHAGLIRQLMCHVLGLPVHHRGDFRIDFAGLTELSFQRDIGPWRLLRFNG